MPKSQSATPSPVELDGPTAVLDDLAAELYLLRQIEDKRARLNELRTTLHNRIKAAMGDNEIGTVAGVPVVTYRFVCSIAVDQSLLKRNHPDVVEKCLDITETRRFVVLKKAAS